MNNPSRRLVCWPVCCISQMHNVAHRTTARKSHHTQKALKKKPILVSTLKQNACKLTGPYKERKKKKQFSLFFLTKPKSLKELLIFENLSQYVSYWVGVHMLECMCDFRMKFCAKVPHEADMPTPVPLFGFKCCVGLLGAFCTWLNFTFGACKKCQRDRLGD